MPTYDPVMEVPVRWQYSEDDHDNAAARLKIDSAAKGLMEWKWELMWLIDEVSDGELNRILISAGMLLHAEAGSIAECIRTATIWERG